MTTREVVEAYFRAWTTHQVDAARALLADDLSFAGPSASYTSADAFYPALAKFASITKSAQIVELLVDGDRAAMLYDAELVTGSVRIASFFRVANGKIVWYDTRFDATLLKPPPAAPGGAPA
jgi:hypothetical protein